MSAPSPPSHVLVFQDPPDPGLPEVLAAVLPGHRLEFSAPDLRRWFEARQAGNLAGLVVDADDADRATLRALAASLPYGAPVPWLLVLVGDRGLAGCEELLELDRVHLVPEPWTPRALATALGSAGRSADAPESGAFLEGLVEGLRDPLTSLTGYLQLLEHERPPADHGSEALLTPALEAARRLERELARLHLAASGTPPAREDLDLQVEAAAVLGELGSQGLEAGAPVVSGEPPGVVHADRRSLHAAIAVAADLLERFGPGGRPGLRLGRDADGPWLAWEAEPDGAVGRRPPPAYLGELLERLARRVPARVVLDRLDGVVPVRVRLRFSAV